MAEHHVYLVGNHSLQNELLVSFLARQTGYRVTMCGTVKEVPDPASDGGLKSLCLVDCLGAGEGEIWERAGGETSLDSEKALLALMNVEPGKGVERDAINRGVRGIFYLNETPELLARGIPHILDGELWYSRKIISQCLLERGKAFRPPSRPPVGLSSREREILAEITSGASNQEIAEALFVSQHTVKTHIYNIYKKINVTSRLQAMLWAAKHL